MFADCLVGMMRSSISVCCCCKTVFDEEKEGEPGELYCYYVACRLMCEPGIVVLREFEELLKCSCCFELCPVDEVPYDNAKDPEVDTRTFVGRRLAECDHPCIHVVRGDLGEWCSDALADHIASEIVALFCGPCEELMGLCTAPILNPCGCKYKPPTGGASGAPENNVEMNRQDASL